MPEFTGKLEGLVARGKRRILLDAETGDIVAGGEGVGGDVKLTDDGGVTTIRLDARGAEVRPELLDQLPVRISGDGSIAVGGAGTDGRVLVRNADGKTAGEIDGESSKLRLANREGDATIVLNGRNGASYLGGYGQDGDLLLYVAASKRRDDDLPRIHLNGGTGEVLLRNAAGRPSAELDGEQSKLRLSNVDGDTTIVLNGRNGAGYFGGRGQNGDVLVYPAGVDDRTPDNASVWIQGGTGDIVLRNADCAEEFDVQLDDRMEPGMVLVLQSDGRLAMSCRPYDTCVAGIVSGAGGVRPGIVLGRIPGARGRVAIGLVGKVVCNVDASAGPISVGTLLTTSDRPGYAMAATDRGRSFGAVIGKAMAPLTCGLGRVPVLVALQ